MKFLYCADSTGLVSLQAMDEKVHLVEDESDSFLEDWFSQQKMGTYLFISGKWEFVKRVRALAFKAGFSEYEMQINVCGPVKKKLICCKCHGVNEVEDDSRVTCGHCGVELEVSDHYSRRLDGYLGYVTIK